MDGGHEQAGIVRVSKALFAPVEQQLQPGVQLLLPQQLVQLQLAFAVLLPPSCV